MRKFHKTAKAVHSSVSQSFVVQRRRVTAGTAGWIQVRREGVSMPHSLPAVLHRDFSVGRGRSVPRLWKDFQEFTSLKVEMVATPFLF